MIAASRRRLCALALALAAASCATEHHAWDAPRAATPAKGSDADYRQLLAEADAAWASRFDRIELEKAIFAWESAAKLRPAHWQVFIKLSQAMYLLADVYLDPHVLTEADRAKYEETLDKGRLYGELAMAGYSPEWKARVQAGAKPEDEVSLIGRDGVAALYWYAANFGKWADSRGFAARRAARDRLVKLMQRCLELDPAFLYGAPDRYLGALYAGSDLEKSQQYFQAALRRAPAYLGTHYLYAEAYAARKHDRELFQKELELVLSSPEDALPDVVPEQRIEKQRARRLLDRINEKF
jgi:hypothetical protein